MKDITILKNFEIAIFIILLFIVTILSDINIFLRNLKSVDKFWPNFEKNYFIISMYISPCKN